MRTPEGKRPRVVHTWASQNWPTDMTEHQFEVIAKGRGPGMVAGMRADYPLVRKDGVQYRPRAVVITQGMVPGWLAMELMIQFEGLDIKVMPTGPVDMDTAATGVEALRFPGRVMQVDYLPGFAVAVPEDFPFTPAPPAPPEPLPPLGFSDFKDIRRRLGTDD